ncbi:MAG TPA: thymidylate synthase [Smithellaceae bacterium]|nr:thymidylate synthase [Smithellaceae bacterium]
MEIVTNTIGEAHNEVVKAIMEDGAEQRIEVEPGKFMLTWEYPEPVMIIVRHPNRDPLKSEASLFGERFMEQYANDILTITKDNPVALAKRERVEGFEYTYPDRLFDYPKIDCFYDGEFGAGKYNLGNGDGNGMNQIQYVIEELTRSPQSRRAIAITWVPELDEKSHEPPCLQFAHFLLRKGVPAFEQRPDYLYLSGRFPFRSHDMLSGYGANAIGLLGLMKHVASKLSDNLKVPIAIGNLVTVSSSAHIYCEAQSEELRAFKKVLRIS